MRGSSSGGRHALPRHLASRHQRWRELALRRRVRRFTACAPRHPSPPARSAWNRVHPQHADGADAARRAARAVQVAGVSRRSRTSPRRHRRSEAPPRRTWLGRAGSGPRCARGRGGDRFRARMLGRAAMKEATMDMRLELVVLPVSDVDKRQGVLRAGRVPRRPRPPRVTDDLRFVQLRPGLDLSIAIGQGLVEGEPGSVEGAAGRRRRRGGLATARSSRGVST